jgi:hypothetical protein
VEIIKRLVNCLYILGAGFPVPEADFITELKAFYADTAFILG